MNRRGFLKLLSASVVGGVTAVFAEVQPKRLAPPTQGEVWQGQKFDGIWIDEVPRERFFVAGNQMGKTEMTRREMQRAMELFDCASDVRERYVWELSQAIAKDLDNQIRRSYLL